MLKLEKVSKYYSAGGVVATGFSKVSLEFDIGEFIAITGESGSGKSTLLNVISGLDSYEEGEMYVGGMATSGFTREELEDYRKRYIGNIFQTFNLINSYTVYQNVELVLLLSGAKREEVAPKVHQIIERVGLKAYENTKASKLSGGQKQRVAIARALAKETPIIVADEPTGNLDTKSAAEIIELLNEISKDKLIIIVTHNYEQVEQYVTRKITMHDGKVVEDKQLKSEAGGFDEPEAKEAVADTLSGGNTLRLGVRNTFNIPAKFILMLVVFVFLCGGTISSYTGIMNEKSYMNSGWNQFFADTSPERIVIKRSDKKAFTKDDYEKIEAVGNIEQLVKDDLILDTAAYISNDSDFWLSGILESASKFEDQIVEGRLPKNDREVLIMVSDSEYEREAAESALGKKGFLTNDNTGEQILKEKIKVVGYGVLTREQQEIMEHSSRYMSGYFCLSDKGLNEIRYAALESRSKITFNYDGQEASAPIKTYDGVPEGHVYLCEDIAYLSDKWAVGQTVKVNNKSLYFDDNYEFTVDAVYTSSNYNYLTGAKTYDEGAGYVYMNPKDYKKMYTKGNYQSSVKVKDVKIIDETKSKLEEMGYDSFCLKDGMFDSSQGFSTLMKAFLTLTLAVTLIALFFVTYFIMKLILKSRNVYFSTVRMLGGTKRNCADLIRVEIITVANIAFAICAGLVALVHFGVIGNIDYLNQLVSYLNVKNMAIIYALTILMSLLLAARYSKSLFKKTAMNAYKEEV